MSIAFDKTIKIWPGEPSPLGATWDGAGVNFALFSEFSEKVELCLFDFEGNERRIALSEKTDQVWHVYLPDARPGLIYGYRVYGPYDPQAGMRFNPSKLLLDPYAKAIRGAIAWDDSLFGYRIGDPKADLSKDERDSAPYIHKGVVIDAAFSWGNDPAPRIPWNKSLIYEAHVKNLTIRHPEVAPEYRGTYAGIASEVIVEHLLSLGVTALELMPVQHFVNDRVLVERGLSNHWGYNTIGFFAPHTPRSTHQTVAQAAFIKSGAMENSPGTKHPTVSGTTLVSM